MANEYITTQGESQAERSQPAKRKSSAARVRALRERRRATGKRLISVYITADEFGKLQELAKHHGWTQAAAVGPCIRHAWKTVFGSKTSGP